MPTYQILKPIIFAQMTTADRDTDWPSPPWNLVIHNVTEGAIQVYDGFAGQWVNIAMVTDITTHAGAADPHTGYQKESEKAAASGYCDLDASVLVPLARIPASLTGKDADTLDTYHAASLEKTANREAVSGYAGLDASQKVIRDPANATATPTASKIPIAGAGGKLAAGWVQEVLAYADLTDDLAVLKSLYDAYSILMATTDDTPVALTVAEQRLIGRITGGAIAALTPAQIMALLSGGATAAFAMASQKITGLAAATVNGDAMRFDETPKLAGDLEGTVAAPTVKAASLTVAGKVEIATAAETTAGTDAGRAVSPDGLAGSDYGKRVMYIKEVIAAATALSTGDAKTTVVIPIELNGWNLVRAEARVYTVGTGATLVAIQIRNVTDGHDMLSTKVTIDASELTSYTAATPSVVDTNEDDVVTADILAVDIDAINNTVVALGLDVILTFILP